MAAFRLDATSGVSSDRLAEFIEGDVDSDIQSVPGIGPANAAKLAAAGTTNTHQLLGHFLTLKATDFSSQEHCDAFWFWLKQQGVNSSRSSIVLCIAEKANMMMPGTFDADDCE